MAGAAAIKMGVKDGTRAFLMNAPIEAVLEIDLPPLELSIKLTGKFDYIHLFAENQAEFNDAFPALKKHLKTRGMLWVSWPKGRKLGTDLNLQKVIQLGYDHGLVESKVVSVDGTWSAIKFTYPKKGKDYQNRYGRLKKNA
ncbi:MAG: hypothetical protein KF726_28120 [Anaerolineae bacterium]|nr:hypothetical protein [Anaerolineae bacterium]